VEAPNNTTGIVQNCSHPAEMSVAVANVVFCPHSTLHLWWPWRGGMRRYMDP